MRPGGRCPADDGRQPGGPMPLLTTSARTRILEATTQRLGSIGPDFARETCRADLATEFDALDYRAVDAFVTALTATAGAMLGRRMTDALAGAILRLADDERWSLSARLVLSVSHVLGAAAAPFLRTICAGLGITLEGIDRRALPRLARTAATHARPVFGPETAEAVRREIAAAVAACPDGLAAELRDLAHHHAGPHGEDLLREVCRASLGLDLDEAGPEHLRPLANAVRTDVSPATITAATAAFAASVQAALVSPHDGLRDDLFVVAQRFIGPAGEEFLRKACARHGVPWEAVEDEHLEWLAETVRAEAVLFIGKAAADDFARSIRMFHVARA